VKPSSGMPHLTSRKQNLGTNQTFGRGRWLQGFLDFSDPANKMVFIFKADQDPEKDKEHPFMLLIIGQPTAMVNGNLVALDVAPEILNGRTMVPLRFVVETLGYQVEWLGNTIRLMK